MKTLDITLESGEVLTLKAVPLGKYPELLNALEIIPTKLSEWDSLTSDEIITRLPKMIAQSLPEIYKILAIGTDLPQEKIDNLVMNDVIDLVMGIWQVNSYAEIFAKIKKAMTRQPIIKPNLNEIANGDGGQ